MGKMAFAIFPMRCRTPLRLRLRGVPVSFLKFLTSAIIGGIIYDLVKLLARLSVANF